MNHERASGLAMIAGSAGLIITLMLHPSDRGLFSPEHYESAARQLIAVHSLALLSLPIWFFGAVGLMRRLGWPGTAGLVFYGFGSAAVMTAITFDGLVSPGLAKQIIATTGTVGQGWRIAFNYNSMIDQAFMRVFIVGSMAAIALWSAAILKTRVLPRGIGIYGLLLSAAGIIALVTGMMNSRPHVFGMAIVGEALWFIAAGVQLWQMTPASTNQPLPLPQPQG